MRGARAGASLRRMGEPTQSGLIAVDREVYHRNVVRLLKQGVAGGQI
jgi:hypothetical protein